MAAEIEVFEGQNREWFWRVQSGNGEIVGSGEGYVSEDGAWDGVRAMAVTLIEACDLQAYVDSGAGQPPLKDAVREALHDLRRGDSA